MDPTTSLPALAASTDVVSIQGPMSVLFGLKPFLLAAVLSPITSALKKLVNIQFGKQWKEYLLVDAVLLPLVPIILGSLAALALPQIRPAVIEPYGTGVACLWGGAVGTFADYIYTKFRKVFDKTDFGNKGAMEVGKAVEEAVEDAKSTEPAPTVVAIIPPAPAPITATIVPSPDPAAVAPPTLDAPVEKGSSEEESA